MNVICPKTIYLHNGDRIFDTKKWVPIKNQLSNKPIGGLWGININNAKEVNETHFNFMFKKSSKVLSIIRPSDIDGVPINTQGILSVLNGVFLDFEELLKMKIDGVEVKSGVYTYDTFCGWDLDSVVVLNPKSISIWGK